MKSILLHVQDDESLENELQTALSLARATEGHMRCLHVTPIEAYAGFDGFGGVFVMQDVMNSVGEHENAHFPRKSAHRTRYRALTQRGNAGAISGRQF